MNPIELLNSRFGIAGHLRFQVSACGLPLAEITTPLASARVALQGAQVCAWQPAGQRPVLWLSGAARCQPGQALRGGVPVCWPWFGSAPGTSSHGFARTRLWQVRASRLCADGQLTLRLGLQDDRDTRALWDHAFDLELAVTAGRELTLQLVTSNTGTAPFTLTLALHSYLAVGDIGQASVHGLDDTCYLDKVNDFAEKRQHGAVHFCGETDRVYIDTLSDCVIDDPVWGRNIRIAKQGSRSTVVWNPGAEKEKTISDLASGEYRHMLCVETANAGPDRITLAAQQMHTLAACISVT